MDKEDLKYIDAGILGCSESGLTEDLSQEVDSEGNPLTKEQVEFFKNSKVRDSKGRLLVCYHGTTATFTTFEKGDIGFHFGTKEQATFRLKKRNKKGNILTCYLNITNPMRVGDLQSFCPSDILLRLCNPKYLTLNGLSISEEEQERLALKYDIASKYTIGKEGSQFEKDNPEDLQEIIYSITCEWGTYTCMDSKEMTKDVQNIFRKNGYDGLVYDNEWEWGDGDYPAPSGVDSYVAFYPNQIKSIDNKNPSDKDDINEELLYHGQDDDDMYDREDTLTWYTTSEEYAKQYGQKIFTKDIDLSKYNLLDLGEINDEVFDNEGNYTKEFKKFCKKIEMTPKQFEKYLKQFGWYPKHLNFIFDITCEYPFYRLLIDLGYDGVKAKEGGYDTYGLIKSELTEDLELSQEVDSEGNPLTPEQVEFFKNSKIRDSKGRLLVCYHGTTEQFDEFFGYSFFTDDYYNADGYAMGEYVYEVYLNLTHPYIFDAKGKKYDKLDCEYGSSTREVISNVDDKNYDGVIFTNINDSWTDDEESGDISTVFVAFYPNQIKSIDNETPSNSNNINEDWLSDANKKETIKQDYEQAYKDLIDNDKTRLYRYSEWASNSNNDYKEYIYNDLLNGKKEDALHFWYNHYKLFTGKYDLSYDDFLNTPITLYRATNVNEKDDTTNPFFSYAQSKKLTQRFLDTTQRLYNNRTGEIEEIQIKPKDTLGMMPSDEYEIIVPNKAYQKRVDDMSSIVDNVIKYANENNVKLPYDRDYILTLFNKRDKENVSKLEAHLMNYIDKRKGNKIKESVDSKTFTFPDLRKAIDFFWKDRDAKIETIPIKKLVDDNDLLDDEDLQSYHQRQWDNKKASEFSIDKSKVNSMRISGVPYAVRKKDGKLELGDGRHRTRALYNDGYEYVTLPVINETLDLSSEISPTINSSKKHDKLITSKRINENTANIPTKKGKAYKVFKVKNGKLYPPMVANSGGKDTPVGVWLDAEEGEFAGLSKTGRPQVKRANKSGVLAYRPGWHLGDIPRAKQFDRLNKETGEYEFPKDFVWAECEYAMDIDYQPEADEQGYMRTKVDDDGNVTTYKSDKYQHSLAGLKKLPTKGYYKYRTNPDPNTVPWVITGQMKVNKLLDDFEVNEILEQNGVEPIHRQGGDKTLKELGLKESKLKESKTTPRIRESLLQEGKQDIENFKKWIENNEDSNAQHMSAGNKEAFVNNWVTEFNSIRQNLKSPYNDFYYWIKLNDWDAFTKFMFEQRNKKDAKQREKDGARLIYSDNNWKVYEITTYEASVKYGANTKWCISGSKRWSNGANGRGYWDDYTSKGVKFYFFIGKDTKYAIAIYPNGPDFEIFDAQDNSIAYIPNAPIIDEIKVDYYSQNEDRLMLNLIKTGQLPHVCSLLSQYLYETGYSINIYDKTNFDYFLQQIAEGVNEDYVKWLAVYNGLKDEEWYKQETGEEYEYEWLGDTTWYIQNDLGFLDNYATLDDALTKDNPYFDYENNEYFICDIYGDDIDCCKDWIAVWLYIDNYILDEDDLINFVKEDIRNNWGYSDFEKVGLSREYLQGTDESLDESLEDFDDEVGKVYHGGIEKSLHKDFRSILWFTEDYDYALAFGENIFICNLNLKNTFIVGNTDGYIRGLIPTQFSTDFTRLANNLKVTPKELLKCNPEAKNIYSIVRTKAFKDLCIKNGYDSVETEEFGHICYGVFKLDQVDIVDTDFEDESTLETLSPMDETLTPRVREELLLEKGTDYKKQAVKIISNSGLFDEETSTKIIDGLFRQDIHAFNHAPAWLEKYLKGIARMLVEYCNGDRSKAQSFLTEGASIFNEYLEWVKQNREKLGNQLDDEFNNNLHYQDVKNKVEEIEKQRDEQSKQELSKMKFDNKSNYTLVPINSFEEFNSKYGGRATGDGSSNKYAGGGGTAWCHANSRDTYDNWISGGYMFFVLQRNDWKDISFSNKTNKEMNGKDDYGNSLIAILVNKYGKLTSATLRCNHIGVVGSADNQYNSYAELSNIAGFNVEEEVLKNDFNKFSTNTLFTVKDGVLIRTYEGIDLYKDITEYTIPNGTIRIGSGAFSFCTRLTSITIPNSVTSIGGAAFSVCASLTSISIPKSVTKIGDSAFSGCSKLTSIIIPPSVTILDNGIFYGCTSLTSIMIPNRVKRIGSEAFYDCTSLTSIEIPPSVTKIGDYAFYDCSSLESITIPNSVRDMGYDIFDECSPNLTVFTDNEYVIRYCNREGIKCAPLSEYHKS